MRADPLFRAEAQARADRIRAWRAELAAAEHDGAVSLTPEQRAGINAYHERLLSELSAAYDVDTSDAQHQLSLGMRIASLLGAVALTGAVVLFFLDIWDRLGSAAQIGIVAVAPLGSLGAAIYASRRERTLYFTAILSVLALGLYILDVSVLGTVLNARPSAMPIVAWSAFALLLAYEWNLGWLLAAGTVGVLASFAATAVWITGFPLDISLQRPELLFVPGAALVGVSGAPFNLRRPRFPQILRRTGLAGIFLAILVLSEAGHLSFLPMHSGTIEVVYQVTGFLLAAAAIAEGVRRRWTEVLNLSAAFFAVLLFLRYVDWWWEWMPRWTFFLLVAVTAIAALLALRKLRARGEGAL
jgi:hypothetical protein